MVVGESNELQRRQLSRSNEFLKLLQPDFHAYLIGDLQAPSRICFVGVSRQAEFRRNVRRVLQSGRIFGLIDELAIVSVSDARAIGEIPQISARWLRDIILRPHLSIKAFVIVASSAAGVVGGN